MMNPEKTPELITDFFNKALLHKQLANTYVFLGNQPQAMMAFILNLAKILNCNQKLDYQTPCGECHHCKWINNNAHPSVMTLTNWDIEEKKLKKSIPVEDLKDLLSELAHHSGGQKRVVILVGATSKAPNTQEHTEFSWPSLLKESAPEKMDFCGLNRQIFSDTVANKLLKSLEEPPLDTHFFILTQQENHLLETILSRAQVIRWYTTEKHDSNKHENELNPDIKTFYEQLWTAPKLSDPMALSEYIQNIAQENNLNIESLMSDSLKFGHQYLENNIHQFSQTQFSSFNHRLERVSLALNQIKAQAKADAVLDNLGLTLTP